MDDDMMTVVIVFVTLTGLCVLSETAFGVAERIIVAIARAWVGHRDMPAARVVKGACK